MHVCVFAEVHCKGMNCPSGFGVCGGWGKAGSSSSFPGKWHLSQAGPTEEGSGPGLLLETDSPPQGATSGPCEEKVRGNLYG